MAGGWLDVTDASGTRRHALTEGLTRVGGSAADVPVPGSGSDELQVWDQPPRAIFIGVGEAPLLGGTPLEEAQLRPGDTITWRGTTLTYGGQAASDDVAPLEEIPVASSAPAAAAQVPTTRGLSPEEEQVWKRLNAGLLVELGLADRVTAKKWQDAVMRDAFDPDQCAAEILARSSGKGGAPKVVERSGRLLRDLLMAPLLSGTRGATRRARETTKGAVAMLVAQGTAFLVYSLIILAILLLLRMRDVDFNGLFDRMIPG